MKIGIIGAGNVGAALGKGLAKKAGHQILFGVTNPKSDKHGRLLAEMGRAGGVASAREAAAFGEAVILAVPWGAVEEVLAEIGDLKGKPLLDATNPLIIKEGRLALEIGHTLSGGERIAALARGAKVVKAFNTTGWKNMENPVYGRIASAMFLAGDDAGAKAVAAGLATDLGFQAIDAGGLAESRLLEAHALLWIHLALYQGHGYDFAFAHLVR